MARDRECNATLKRSRYPVEIQGLLCQARQLRLSHRLSHIGTALAALALQGVQVADAPALSVLEGSYGERIRYQQPTQF
jgi:hypothetical protein